MNTVLQALLAFTTRSYWDQSYPPPATFTETDLRPGEFVDRVFVITGGNSGLGFELIKLLYPTGATIYMACRSRDRAEQAIRAIIETSAKPGTQNDSQNRLKHLQLDLNDLVSVKAAAAELTTQENRLDVLWNNAGIGGAPVGTTTKQRIEGHVGVNCVAPLLFTEEVMPLLRAATNQAPKDSVRVVWTGSLSIETFSPAGGVDFSLLGMGETQAPARDYAMSKVGNWFLAIEGAKRYGGDGIISLAENPGQLATDVWKHQPEIVMKLLRRSLHDKKLGAYTMLFAGLSHDVTLRHNGAYVLPWGRILDIQTWPRKDILAAIQDGQAEKFWLWCERQWQSRL